ncbi:MAG: helix-hairpin-helix domain-containing protein, partial [Acidimicrobiia bacterium]|nr:helix-hairpin-helix domain-containing protein [Acidimicrobiia bacterium]
ELKGFGPATEAKLYESGVRTWAALAEVLDAVARIKDVDAKRLRNLRNAARDRVDDPAPASGGDGERTAQFVVRVVARPDGQVARCSVTDVRSGLENSHVGISGGAIVDFIQERLRVGTSDSPAPDVAPARSVPVPTSEAPTVDPDALHLRASSTRGEVVVMDAGKCLGGTGSQIDLRWDTSDIDAGDAGVFRYRASLAGRGYGASAPSHWMPLGVLIGDARPGEILDLVFEATGLSPGVNRLELTLELQPVPEPNAGPRRVEVAMAGQA